MVRLEAVKDSRLFSIKVESNDSPLSRQISQGGAVVARKAHNLEVGGSIPSPATTT
jgi:hypothetical protein